MESHARQRIIYAATVRPKSLYEDVHASTGHPGYIGMRWHQQNTTQTRTQQLPEVYVKDVHSAVLTSILLISTMLNQLSHTTLINRRRRCLHTPQCWNLRIHICSPLHRPRITPGISSLLQVQACHGAHCSDSPSISHTF